MLYKFTFIIAFILSILLVKPTFAGQFVGGMEDVPVMQGMQQITKDDVSFGNEEVRLVEAYFSATNVAFSRILSFYIESLPQLGWIFQGYHNYSLLFYRDGETLEVVKESVSPLVIRITVKSKL